MDKRITATTIQVGVDWFDASKLNSMTGSSTGNATVFGGGQRSQAQAVADYINSHGGLAGRKIVIVFRERDPSAEASPGGPDQEGQTACAHYTEDHHVFAMVAPPSQTLLECARKTKTTILPVLAAASLDQHDMVHAGVFYTPSGLRYERRARALVKSLVRQRFFGKGAKVGLLIQDLPGVKRTVQQALLPALEQAGIDRADVVQIVFPHRISSPWQNYAVTFQQEGVTHVLFAGGDGGPLSPTLFMQAAEQEQYRPFYGLGDEYNPGAIKGLGAPRAQFSKVRGVGGMPIYVTATSVGTPAAKLCTKIMNGAEEPQGAQGAGQGWFYCDALFFLKAVFDRAKALTPEGFRSAAEALGTSYDSVLTWVSHFGPGRYDGGHLVRDYAYDAGCDCYKFVSEEYEAPAR